jgi:DNA-binding response OmpR family regulator
MSKILIIEDDQIVANIYRSKLAAEGYQVEVAADGEQGLAQINTWRPNAVILDLVLPKLSGVDLLKKVRAEAEFKTLPVIVFTNTYLSNLIQEAKKAGATKLLSKTNCTPKQVVDIVKSTLTANGAAAPAPAGSMTAPRPKEGTAANPAGPITTSNADAEFQAELRRSFIETVPGTLAALRTHLQGVIKADTELNRLKQVHEMYRRIHNLTGNSGVAGMLEISHMSDALEALLKEIYEKPKNINASTLRTVASAIDFLKLLLERAATSEHQEIPPSKVLVVDDEAISRRAVTYALEKARLKAIAVEDPNVAYTLLAENRFDLIFLDVDMPGMNGYELCTKLRELPAHKKTPVVFVTSLTDFESRANSMMSGGNDFIAKPFLFIELAVKALVYVLRGRLESR